MSQSATIEVFAPPMCCASGMCGPSIDDELVRFNATFAWLEREFGNAIAIQRVVPNQEPHKFMQNKTVMSAIRDGGGWSVLPITLVNGRIVKQGIYPSLQELTAALDGCPARR